MRVVIAANPRSGRGRAIALARDAAAALNARGIDSTMTPVGPGCDPVDLRTAVRGARALLVAGGDGTIASMAGVSIETGVPIVHLPTGNENLFAREHGHGRRLEAIVSVVESGRVRRTDCGSLLGERADGSTIRRRFLLMASLGPDASVIQRLDRVRSKASGHLAYVGPIIEELWDVHFPKYRVEVDGRAFVDDIRGNLLVANSRQYALRVDPARMARVDDGVLDVVSMPCETVAEYLVWQARCRARMQFAGRSGAAFASGASVVIESLGGPAPVQIDGESVGDQPLRRVEIQIDPGALPVLVAE